MYRIGVPAAGTYSEVFTTNAAEFGGTGVLNSTKASEAVPMHGFAQSLSLTLPPLSVIYLKLKKAAGAPKKARRAGAKTINKTAASRKRSTAVKEG